MSLFGGAASQTRSRNLVEFKAGKMNLRGNMVCSKSSSFFFIIDLFFFIY
jgi:hypothetical protein